MEEPPSLASHNGAQASKTGDPSTTFDTMRDLLKARDDTSRFVGLALLKSVLDNEALVNDSERLHVLWEAVSPKFLDRLLRAEQGGKTSKEEARNMIDLAVSILHTFTVLLPEASRKEKRLTGRTAPLIKALLQSPPDTTSLILQTLLTITSQQEGAKELLSIQDVTPLVEIASQYSLALDILRYMWTNVAAIDGESDKVRESINRIIPSLLLIFKGTDGVTLMSSIADLLPKLEPSALPQSPKWLKPLISMLQKLVTSKPTSNGRAVYTQMAAGLLQCYPATCPNLLFAHASTASTENKPFSYLFIALLLIDLRSSFPSLLSNLNSSNYPAISQRLAAAFDVVSSFIGFLVRSLDEDTGSSCFSLAPDLLLKLRKEIAETMSLTIEYLRDRWDASVAGASGLHPSARAGTAATSEGTRLTLTWESMEDNVNSDPLVLAGIRALAVWIREDENENLRNESAGLMDMWIELYKSSAEGALDFRYPILLALEGIVITEEGVDSFLGQEGWQTLFGDLQTILNSTMDDQNSASVSNASRGLQIIRIMLAVVDHPFTHVIQEDWMTVVIATTGIKVPEVIVPPIVLEFQIAMVQLAMALLSKSAGGMTKRYVTSQAPLSGLIKRLNTRVEGLDDRQEAVELKDLLEDARLELENLRHA